MYKVMMVQALYPDMVKEYKQAKNKLFAVYLTSDYIFCHKGAKKRKMVAINLDAKMCPSLFDKDVVKQYCDQVIGSLNQIKISTVVKKKRKSKKNPNPKNDKPLLGTLEYYDHKVFMRSGSKVLQVLAATDDLANEMIFNSELK